jgi:hypothetical protein
MKGKETPGKDRMIFSIRKITPSHTHPIGVGVCVWRETPEWMERNDELSYSSLFKDLEYSSALHTLPRGVWIFPFRWRDIFFLHLLSFTHTPTPMGGGGAGE